MLYAVANPARRADLLTRAARRVGLRTLRDDPCAFATLLERTIGENDRWFMPRAAPDALSIEEVRVHGGRLEDLVDEAVCLALEIYPKKRRDAVLLTIASHAERLMRRIWSDPWSSGAKLIAEVGRHVPAEPQDNLRSLSKLSLCCSPDDKDPSAAR
jgi:hypothetical protein